MVGEVSQCMVVEPGTFGSATSLVSERAVAFARLADSMAARVASARSLRSCKAVSLADIKGVAKDIGLRLRCRLPGLLLCSLTVLALRKELLPALSVSSASLRNGVPNRYLRASDAPVRFPTADVLGTSEHRCPPERIASEAGSPTRRRCTPPTPCRWPRSGR